MEPLVLVQLLREIERKTGKKLSDKQWNKLHDRISGQNYGYHDIVEEGCLLLNGITEQNWPIIYLTS